MLLATEAVTHAAEASGIAQKAWLIPLLPALSFLVILFFGKKLPKGGAESGILAVGLSFVLSVLVAVDWITNHTPVDQHWVWWHSGHFKITIGQHVDGLAAMMFVVVTFVSLMVHIYSTGYMHGDVRFTYFFAALSLFTASMLFMVLADNLLQLMVGWELVGLCSFMLIGHWFEEKNNSSAALKAFFTTRTGDVGLMLGIITLFFAAEHTFHIDTINKMALEHEIGHGVLLAGALLLFLGVMGKSAQFPLHIWLPDAMAGPTPVSALIHAATMVVAGVYLVARVYGVFWEGFSIEAGGLNWMALIAGITMIIAAALAFVQDDIKRVLAYSTVSQLGYMVAALSVGAWTAGVFHLFTHAFFKALLFLGSGSVIHAVHSNNMSEMGGLKKYMPTTFVTFVIGTIALAGIAPLAGFWSKDEILLGAMEDGYPFILAVGLIGAFMTACYMGRCVFLTFFGEYRGHGHPHESPRSMTVPLILLAIPSVLIGLINAPGILKFTDWVAFHVPGADHFHTPHHDFNPMLAAISVLVAVAGLAVAGMVYYWQRVPAGLRGATDRGALRGIKTLLIEKYYLDRLFVDGLVGFIKGPLARATYWTNQKIIDGIVNAVGYGTRIVGRFTYDILDQKGVDGIVNGIGVSASETGGILRLVQSGRVQQYALMLFAAVGLLGLALIFFT
ncbi:MAG TPA: NADH-quinone oxidoreductase subunit L [Acidimicrobiia bacterium]|nr:NADH-quinone oxidoreductase subunit L [Acidimicrobiia bacterium]